MKTLDDARLILQNLKLPHPRYPTVDLPYPHSPEHLRKSLDEIWQTIKDNGARLEDLAITQEELDRLCKDIRKSYIRFCTEEIWQALEILRHKPDGIHALTAAMHAISLDMRDLSHDLDWSYQQRAFFEAVIPKQ